MTNPMNTSDASGTLTISEALAQYLSQLEADGRSSHTINQARRHIGMLRDALGDVDATTVTNVDVARFLGSERVTKRADGGPRKPNSANALRSSLRCFFHFLHVAGHTRANAARLVRRARCAPPRPRALHAQDVERLVLTLEGAITAAEKRDRALFRTMLGLGLRVGSVVGLDVGDLDLQTATLNVRVVKNGDTDTVFLPPPLVELLRGYVGTRASGPLFPRETGERLGARQIGRRLEIWAERAGIERSFSPHALRHSFAMAAYERTGDVLLVSRMLLHRSLASTSVYARPSEARVREAMADT